MDSPSCIAHEPRASLSPCNGTSTSRRRRSSDSSNSPEFEFWMVRNPSFPQPNLLSADELFVDGVLLPLQLLSHKNSDDPPDQNPQPYPEPENKEPVGAGAEPEAAPGPELRHVAAESATGLTSSKRWRDIFKKGDKKSVAKNVEDKDNKESKEKEKKREKKSQSGASSAELNINIWPFSRSRSAGNGGTRPRLVPVTRKVSSAPCSRSNSAGESKSRKWPSSPGRAGVHLGRSSPIWQVKRGGGPGLTSKSSDAQARSGAGEKMGGKKESRGNKLVGGGSNNGGGKARVLNLNLNVNVPTCIGYRHHLSCRSDENSAIGVAGVAHNRSSTAASNSCGGGGGGGGNNNGAANSGNNLFNFRSLFTKKVY